MQRPGDIIYVPPRWYHAVVNLDSATIAGHNAKRQRLGPDLEVVVGKPDQASELHIDSAFRYILALQVLH